MSQGKIQLDLPTTSGPNVDTLSITRVDTTVVQREIVVLGGSADGDQIVPVSGRLPVDGSGVTQPISAASLPLPTGAATSANQSTANTSLASIDAKTPALSGGKVPVDGSGVTQPISAASLPLPSNAAQETGGNLATLVTKTTDIPNVIGTPGSAVPSKLLIVGGSDGTNARPTLLDSSGRRIVTGATAVGATMAGNPIPFAGVDDTPYVRSVSVDTYGRQRVSTSNKVTYFASVGQNGVQGAITANAASSICYLWHPSSSSARVEIVGIGYTSRTGSNGQFDIRGSFISAENGTPGGSTSSIAPMNRGDAASACTFRYNASGAPTRVAGEISFGTFVNANTPLLWWAPSDLYKPIQLRPSVGEGFEIRVVNSNFGQTTAQIHMITLIWTEEIP